MNVWYCIHPCSWVWDEKRTSFVQIRLMISSCHSVKMSSFNYYTFWSHYIGLQLKLKAKFFLANYLGLLCSSHSNNSWSVEFRFKYAPHTGKNFTASCHANQTGIIHYNNSHWLIYRRRRHHMIAYWQSRTTLMTMIVIMNVLAASSLMGKLKKLHQII